MASAAFFEGADMSLVLPGLQQAQQQRSKERADQHDLHCTQTDAPTPVHVQILLSRGPPAIADGT